MLHRLATITAATLFALFLGQGSALATGCSVPNIFVNNTIADADQMDANFAAILACINVNAVVGPNSSTLHGAACWGNTAGSLLEGCPAIPGLIVQPSGRITYLTGTPVMNGSAGPGVAVLYTPYLGSLLSLYDGTNWNAFKFSELSNVLANSATGHAGPAAAAADSCYDLFIWNAGTITSPILTLTRGPAFTTCSNVGGSAARAAGGGISTVDGLPLNTSTITNGPAALRGLFVGTFFTDSTANVSFNSGGIVTPGNQSVWNAFNRVMGRFTVIDTGAFYIYVPTTIREARGSGINHINILQGNGDDGFWAAGDTKELVAAVTGASTTTGVAYNDPTAFNCQGHIVFATTNNIMQGGGGFGCARGPTLGKSVVYRVEAGDGVQNNQFDSFSDDELDVFIRY